MARCTLTTVPGSDPVLPAAHRRASTGHTGHPVATADEPERLIWRWPSRRHVRSGNSLASRSRRAPGLTPHPGHLKLLHAKMTARRDRSVCAPVPGPHPLKGRLAPSSRSKLALFFRSVPPSGLPDNLSRGLPPRPADHAEHADAEQQEGSGFGDRSERGVAATA
jgi:hypothetical protein